MTRVKTFLASAILALCAVPTFGQGFVVTPEGLRDSADATRGFVVITVEGATAKQLYDNTLKYIMKTYTNPDIVIKAKVDGDYIRLTTYSDNMAPIKNGWSTLTVKGDMTTELTFKEGKVKYEVTALDMGIISGPQGVLFQGGLSMKNHIIYNKAGKLQLPETKKGLEEFFNSDIRNLSAVLKPTDKGKSDNW